MRMDCAVRHAGDVIVLDLSGHISPGKSIADRCALHHLVTEQVNGGHNKILLNLREVTHVDSSGLGDLLESLNFVRSHGGELRICNATGRVSVLLHRTHLESVLEIDLDEPAALQAFSAAAEKTSAA